MKKVMMIVLGAAALVACTKTSVSYEETGEIAFAPVVSLNTKAAVEGTAFPAANEMGVYAFYDEAAAAGTAIASFNGTAYLNNATFAKNGSVWAGKGQSYYWPKTGSLVFAAYSPVATTLSYDLASDTFSVAGYTQASATDKTVDLLYSNVTATSYASQKAGVPMKFNHAMSWVTIKGATDKKANNLFKISSLTIKKVNTVGDLAATSEKATWSNVGTTADIAVFAAADADAAQVLDTTAAAVETNANGTVVVPQTIADELVLEVKFYQNNGQLWLAKEQTTTVKLNSCKQADGTAITAWEAGKHYIYTLSFKYSGSTDPDDPSENDYEITIAPEINDWTTVNAEAVEAK